ncbi:MAG: hypothetical protein WC683_19900 [bacterium]
MRSGAMAAMIAALACGSCSKPMVTGRVTPDVRYFSRDYASNPNDTYYAVRWALKETGYPVEGEDLPGGVITTKWLPVTSDSHYVEVFGEPDYGVTNSYYQIEVHISSDSGRTVVEVGARAKTVAHNLKSSGVEERKVLARIGDYLRSGEPNVTNLGINE